MQDNKRITKTGSETLLMIEKSAISIGLTAVTDKNNVNLNTDHLGLVKYNSNIRNVYLIVR